MAVLRCSQKSLVIMLVAKVALSAALVLVKSARFCDALCVCGQLTKKAYNSGDGYSSAYTIVNNVGCEDKQLATECDAVRYEIDEFIAATMEHLDDTYVRFMSSMITDAVARGNLTVADALAVREIMENQRLSALDALTDRKHPHCADGLYTTTLYNSSHVRYEYKDWRGWDLNDMRNQLICYSPKLLETLERLRDENQVQLDLRFDESIEFAPEFNARLEKLIEADPSNNTGLSPYTKAVMTKVLRQVNDGVDIGGLGVADGRLFVMTMLKRVTIEDPDVQVPVTELTELQSIELSDAGEHAPKCLPLSSLVLVLSPSGACEAIQLADLSIGDEVVISADSMGNLSTTTVIDVSHRIDEELADFVHIKYANADTRVTSIVIASADHNVEFAVYSHETFEYLVKKATFGKLRQAVHSGNEVALRNGVGGWMPVISVGKVTERGYVAPITASGTIVLVPKQRIATTNNVEASETFTLLAESAQLSTYSTVPDSVGKVANSVKRMLFGASGNEDGVGTGFVFDCFSRAGEVIGRSMGHLAES